jgi:hypothetical protein
MEVVAIVAGPVSGALVGALFALLTDRRSQKRKRQEDMVLSALEHFGGGSQRRSVGIAALQVVLDRASVEKEYRETVARLYFAQLLYLFVHGSNRWESHEIANIEAMTNWLLVTDESHLWRPWQVRRARV